MALTPKTRSALAALRRDGTLTISNRSDLAEGIVYWQQAQALVDAGHARQVGIDTIELIEGGE